MVVSARPSSPAVGRFETISGGVVGLHAQAQSLCNREYAASPRLRRQMVGSRFDSGPLIFDNEENDARIHTQRIVPHRQRRA
jgi:hypothetical protein